MFKAIFWDNDGTLVDTEMLFYRASRQILAEAGVALERDYYIHKVLKHNLSSFDLLPPLLPDELEKLRQKRDELYVQYLNEGVKLFDGALDVLRSLHRKVTMGIVTSSKKSHFDIIMEQAGTSHFFDFTITTEDSENDKPNPDPYLLALKRSGLQPAECLVVEDTERGVTAAKAAGLTCYAVPNELSRENDFSKADRVLSSLKEILEAFKPTP
jgi:HAD superfamily hydrolase (TIGR01509 family)